MANIGGSVTGIRGIQRLGPKPDMTQWAKVRKNFDLLAGAAQFLTNRYINLDSTGKIQFDFPSASNIVVLTDGSGGLNTVASVLAGYVLTDNGGGVAPTFQAIPAATGSLAWTKVTKDYTAFSHGSTPFDIELYSLAAAGVLHAVKIKHSVKFIGTGIGQVVMNIGLSGTLNKYIASFDVSTTVTSTNLKVTGTGQPDGPDQSNATSIRIQISTTGNVPSALTAGSVDCWLLTSIAA